MRSVFCFVLISASLLFAQSKSVDSSSTVSLKDGVRISDLVQQQINKAKEKQSIQTVPIVKVVTQSGINQPVNKEIPGFFSSLPLHIKLFFSISIVILLVITFRRAILAFKKRASQILKNKITMLREEKVVTRTNPKLEEARKKLRNSKSIFDTTDKHISKVAKGLNIAKGELLLASRLKIFEIGKM
ncbi:MAG: hypothetical protein NTX65_11365 [Ignavibacteriales bacterium]|nr:hypothetical protein [Ignavibacteriales bacterium]